MPDQGKYLIELINKSLDSFDSNAVFKNTGGKSVTYSELKSNLTSNTFFSKYSDSCGLIAVLSEKKPEVVQLFFSILLSGNAYLPLDYHSPAERILYILKNSGVKILVLEKGCLIAYSKILENENIKFAVKEYNTDYSAIVFEAYKIYESGLAYVLYTSGSTGVPKGVMHSQLSAITFINWCKTTFKFKEGSKFLSIAPFNFDLSILDIFVSLSSGGCLVIPTYAEVSNSRLIAKYIDDFKINVMYSTPTFFKTLMRYGKIENMQFKNVTHLLIAGEQLRENVVLDLTKYFTKAEFYNLYGPTETNVCLFHKIDLNSCIGDKPVPIGKACDYATIMQEPKDDLHELHVSGNSLMLSYVGKENERINKYNTGDLVKKDANDDYIFFGRSDRMVKRNGYRIELAEIESCLEKYTGISECLASVINGDSNLKIATFFVCNQKITDLQLKNYCLTILPAYMIPDIFVQVKELNVNSNFKIDINKLLIENDLSHLTGL